MACTSCNFESRHSSDVENTHSIIVAQSRGADHEHLKTSHNCLVMMGQYWLGKIKLSDQEMLLKNCYGIKKKQQTI